MGIDRVMKVDENIRVESSRFEKMIKDNSRIYIHAALVVAISNTHTLTLPWS